MGHGGGGPHNTPHTSTSSSAHVSAMLLSVAVAAKGHSGYCSTYTLWQLEVPLAKVLP